jgi:hypothetical protein
VTFQFIPGHSKPATAQQSGRILLRDRFVDGFESGDGAAWALIIDPEDKDDDAVITEVFKYGSSAESVGRKGALRGSRSPTY